ncbi:MarR family winged helix-turn-helix transcriptional regulator [Variovorax terrae]|uniref:MarR family winged helix-turn-helix transcriptional regulator n=1 Tax=Variovorax terrae TaxID=2923278 RepID=A0A9X2ANI9_9BURK|nr:MarR family winged helix-turn-helix transcriptional regulator [Variovorax terrae]MCJ0762487.1 MarR family winged helix-turn-helix transcriptional regulator [Variovorax terrae]
MLNFRVSEFYGVSGSLVTRLCEGEFGVTREEWGFIAMLAALGPLSPSDLAAWTSVDRSQGSRTLRGLLDKKLIFRRRVAGDGRRVKVVLSAAGRELYRHGFPQVVKIHRAMLSTLNEEEIATLARCLRKMQEAATVVYGSDLVGAQADRRHGGSRSTWVEGRFDARDDPGA